MVTVGAALGALVIQALLFAHGAMRWRSRPAVGQGRPPRKGDLAWWINWCLTRSAVMAGFGVGLAAAGLPALVGLDHSEIRAVGSVVALIGVGISLWALACAAEGRLVGTGPYGLSRHPFLSPTLLVGTGVFLLAPNIVTLGGLVMLLVGIELQVRLVEERQLEIEFGHGYVAYARRVGRFVPGLGRRAATDVGRS